MMEALQPSTEAQDPTPEVPDPMMEALQPSIEASDPTTEALQPSTETLHPSTEALNPSFQEPQAPILVCSACPRRASYAALHRRGNPVTQDASRGARDAGERAGTSEAERRERLTRLVRRRSKLPPTKLEEQGERSDQSTKDV